MGTERVNVLGPPAGVQGRPAVLVHRRISDGSAEDGKG